MRLAAAIHTTVELEILCGTHIAPRRLGCAKSVPVGFDSWPSFSFCVKQTTLCSALDMERQLSSQAQCLVEHWNYWKAREAYLIGFVPPRDTWWPETTDTLHYEDAPNIGRIWAHFVDAPMFGRINALGSQVVAKWHVCAKTAYCGATMGARWNSDGGAKATRTSTTLRVDKRKMT